MNPMEARDKRRRLRNARKRAARRAALTAGKRKEQAKVALLASKLSAKEYAKQSGLSKKTVQSYRARAR